MAPVRRERVLPAAIAVSAGAPPSTRPQEAARAWRREDVAFPGSRTGSRLRTPAGAFAGELLELQDRQGVLHL